MLLRLKSENLCFIDFFFVSSGLGATSMTDWCFFCWGVSIGVEAAETIVESGLL